MGLDNDSIFQGYKLMGCSGCARRRAAIKRKAIEIKRELKRKINGKKTVTKGVTKGF